MTDAFLALAWMNHMIIAGAPPSKKSVGLLCKNLFLDEFFFGMQKQSTSVQLKM
jgi:hypothetical protein